MILHQINKVISITYLLHPTEVMIMMLCLNTTYVIVFQQYGIYECIT